jgi:hypothetical protein
MIGDIKFNGDLESIIFTFPLLYDFSAMYCGSYNTRQNAPLQTFKAHAGNSSKPSFSNLSSYDRLTRNVHEGYGRLGVMITANTAEGYLHMSRLSWPTVPPMVRAPFANLVPDFMVINEQIWANGLGAVQLAGFWDKNWRFSEDSSYTGI